MNKSDLKLILIILIIIGITYALTSINKKGGDIAEVYYEDKLIKTIDLNTDKEYRARGLLGDIVIEVKDKKVRVKEENSPKHLCSKEGYTNDSSKPIICLPNKIVIKVVSDSSVDGVVY